MTPHAYHFAPYRLLPQQRQLLTAGEQQVKLGGRAFDVLLALVERRDRTVGKHELIDLVWPRLVVEENNLQVQIVALRKLLGHAAIATVPGRGYRFTLQVQTDDGTLNPAAGDPVATDPAGNLPGTGTTLLGRSAELEQLRDLLDAHAVVTVAGAGGIGKTRLAQDAGMQRRARLSDPVYWVELAPLSDPTLVPEAVARALGLPLGDATDATTAVLHALQGSAALLVLDNAEHLIDGVVAFATAVRHGAAGIKLLVTSQEVLRALDEHVFRLGPLSLPLGDELDALQASGAVELFVARATAAVPRFKLGDHNRAAVADICRRLDGIALAIEFAAARVPLLGVEGVRTRLGERFNVLTAGTRAVMRRHQTLRAALDWSHGLLTPQERAVFRRLGVFAGGFTLDTAQSVAGDDTIDVWDVLENLGGLVDKSLVVAEGDPIPRYRLLETTRLYALERLAEANETEALMGRHASEYLALALRENVEIERHGQGAEALQRLDGEHDNLLCAMAWCERAGETGAAIGQGIAAALRNYWPSRGLLTLGLRLTLAALSHAQLLPFDRVRSLALGSATQMHIWLGQHVEALELAMSHQEQALACGDKSAAGLARAQAGMALCLLGQVEDAEVQFEAALASASQADDLHRRCVALTGLAAVEAARGSPRQLDLMREVVALRRPQGHAYNLAAALMYLARGQLDNGMGDANEPLLAELVALLPGIGSRYLGQQVIDLVAAEAARRGDWSNHVKLVSASERLRQASAMPLHSPARARQLRDKDGALTAIGQAEFDRTWAAGRLLDYDNALALAIALARNPDPPVPR